MDIEIHQTPEYPTNILSMPGKIANHVRWLLLLDNRYQFTFIPSSENYHQHHCDGWPSYDRWIEQGLDNRDLVWERKVEILSKLRSGELDPIIPLRIMRHKWNFIRSWMYHKDRSYHAWLSRSWPIPALLDRVIPISREQSETNPNPNQKTMAIVIDPVAALAHHSKFHPGITAQQKQQFQDDITQHNAYVRSIESTGITVIDATPLLTGALDRTLYTGLRMSYLQNHFDHAVAIHATWLEGLANLQTDFLGVTDSIYRC